MTHEKQEKQKKLTQDYANFLIEHEAARTQGKALGTFLEWQHNSDRTRVSEVHSGDK